MIVTEFDSRVLGTTMPGPIGGPVPTRLTHDPDGDPLAVKIEFTDGVTVIPWTIGRDLLRDIVHSMNRTTGDCDIRGQALSALRVALVFRSPDGTTTISMPRRLIVDFLHETYEATRERGGEQRAIEAALATFLAGRPTHEYSSDGWNAQKEGTE